MGLSSLGLRAVRSGCNFDPVRAIALPSVVCLVDIIFKWRFGIVGHCYDGALHQHFSRLEGKRPLENQRPLSFCPSPDVLSVAGFLRRLRDRKVRGLLGITMACDSVSSRVEDLLRRRHSAKATSKLRRLCEKDETSYSICVLSGGLGMSTAAMFATRSILRVSILDS